MRDKSRSRQDGVVRSYIEVRATVGPRLSQRKHPSGIGRLRADPSRVVRAPGVRAKPGHPPTMLQVAAVVTVRAALALAPVEGCRKIDNDVDREGVVQRTYTLGAKEVVVVSSDE